jgi:ABC-type polysaccharide/polyol phosphate export permease
VLALFGQPVHFEGLLVALPVLAVLAIAVTGLTLCFAALQVFIRDVEHVLMPLLMILMYLTPILYPLTAVPESVRPYVAANPFGYLVKDCVQRSSMDGSRSTWPTSLHCWSPRRSSRWTLVFRRLSPTFEDFL